MPGKKPGCRCGAYGKDAGLIQKGDDSEGHIACHGADDGDHAVANHFLNRLPGDFRVLLIVFNEKVNLTAVNAAGLVALFNNQLHRIPP